LDQSDAADRRRGYVQALADAGIPLNPDLIIEGDFRQPAGVLAIESLLARGVQFTAVFGANDQMIYGARLALFRRGIRVPDDVSLVGFDDQDMSAYMTPPLTTMRQPGVEMGEAAALALLQLLKNDPVELPAFQAKLIIRESVLRLS
jgi:LacI family transcriptional regulator